MTDDVRLTFASAPSADAVTAVRARWRQSREYLRSNQLIRPFVVVTPLGLAVRERVEDLFREYRVTVVARRPLPDWPGVSTLLYARTDDDERLTVALAFEELWRSVVLDARAERWDLAGPDDFTRMVAAKSVMRERLGVVRVNLTIPSIQIHPDGVVRLRALHVPDPDRVGVESRLLDGIR